MQQLVLLGSTGSIGRSTLAVIALHPHRFAIFALVAKSNSAEMARQCLQFRPRFAALWNKEAAQQLQKQLQACACPTEVVAGEDEITQLVAQPEVDQVVAAIVGAAGLLPTFSAAQAGKRVLLANKESLVIAGALLMKSIQQSGAQIVPIDSEHSGIFQCLPVQLQAQLGHALLEQHGIQKIVLTGSGGAVHQVPSAALAQVTPEQACRHPNWSMGRKISVDSATMMNKGLEYIEARWLFNAHPQQIEIILHPQSIVHAMVHFIDGSVLMQCSKPDMRSAIGYALSYPERIPTGVELLDFTQRISLTFLPPEAARYPCLQLAIAACCSGQAAVTMLNAANEIAVEAFLQRQIRFTDIAQINEKVLTTLHFPEPHSIEEILAIDQQARCLARQQVVQ